MKKMDKDVAKILFGGNIFASYVVNLICMFSAKPIEILIANLGVWLILVGICLFFWFFDKE